MTKHRTEAAALLAEVRGHRAVEDAAAAAVLRGAVRWADLHPPAEDGLPAESSWRGRPTGVPLAGVGTPEVDESCVAELAAALGCSTDAGSALLGQTLELRHRLPRLWALVQDQRVPAWRARRVAASTTALSPGAAGFVDDQVAAVAGRVGPTQLDRLVSTAVMRFMPVEAERRRLAADDARCFEVHHDRDGSRHGQAEVSGVLDLPDALDLDAAVTAGARALAEAGCDRSLDVRRSMAVGELARRQPALDLAVGHHPKGTGPVAERVPTASVAPPRVTLYLHLEAAALTGPDGLPGWVGNTGVPVTAGQVRDWCGRPGTRVTVRPVLDLNQERCVPGREVPARLREHIALRDRTCVFPWCTRPAHPRSLRRRADGSPGWSTDADHTVAHGDGGPTSTDNLAPLCRRHHRLKTFHRWRYRRVAPGCYEWTSPHGLRFTRDADGTSDRSDPPPARAAPPAHRSPEQVGPPRLGDRARLTRRRPPLNTVAGPGRRGAARAP